MYYLAVHDPVNDTTYNISAYVEVNNTNLTYIKTMYDQTSFCNLTQVNFHAEIANPNGYLFEWSCPNLFDFYTQDITTTFPTPTNYSQTYNVTLTIKNATPPNAIIFTESVVVTVYDCCNEESRPFDILLLDNTTISDFLATNPTFTNTIAVHGLLTLDQSWTVPSIVKGIHMLPPVNESDNKSCILLNENFDFKMSNVKVNGCHQLWDGILAFGDSIIHIKPSIRINNCIISDACNAIYLYYLTNEAYLLLETCDFINNYNGVIIGHSESFDPIISATTFEGSNILLPASGISGCGSCPNNNVTAYPQNGIILLRDSFLVLKNHGPNEINLIQNLVRGIVAWETPLLIEKNAFAFKDIPGFITNPVIPSFAILAYEQNDSVVSMIEKIGNEQNTTFAFDFENCGTCIEIGGKTDAIIKNNKISSSYNGIEINAAKYASILVENNEINCYNNGIKLWQCSPVTDLKILNNYITIQNATNSINNVGIRIDDNNQASFPGPFLIKQNIIDIYKGRYGIYGQGCSSINIFENTVFLNKPDSNWSGIEMRNGIENVIKCNSIYGYQCLGDTSLETPFGIRSTTSLNSEYSYNYTDGTYSGLGFCGIHMGLNTIIKRNRMINHRIGLNYADSLAQTANQSLMSNTWEGGFTIKAQNRNPVPNYSIYTVGLPQNTIFDPLPQISGPNGWFNEVSAQNPNFPWICTDSPSNSALIDNVLKKYDTTIALNQHTFPKFNEPMKWSTTRWLY